MATEIASEIENMIRKAMEESLANVGAHDVKFAVERPTDLEHGDFAVNAAFAAAKALGKEPRELASELARLMSDKLTGIAATVDVAGSGFINITLAQNVVTNEIEKANQLKKEWGRSDTHENKKVMVEYTDPNPFKEMHIGHLMSNMIGESIERLIEFSGATVARANNQGDVGPHVAKALWGLRDMKIIEPTSAEEIGTAYAHGSRAYEEDPKAKEEIDALNVALYKGDDRELMELWRKGRNVSLEAFERIYRLVGTKFDYYFFESETSPIGLDVVKDGLKKGIFEESDGAIIYKGEKVGLHTLVFVTSRDTPTYEAKELGLAFLKEERWPSDESIIITANEQTSHFKVFLAALVELAPLLAEKTKHVPHGFLRLSTGKMSSREGNVITAEKLIREVAEKVSERNPDPLIAEQIAVGAISYSILKSTNGSDIVFDIDKSVSLEGDSGLYLQYALVRAKSVVAQAETKDAAARSAAASSAPPVPFTIERLILRFPSIVLRAQNELSPHYLTHYLTQLAGEWNSFYAKERIIGDEFESYKLNIARAFTTTMENGMHLLHIPILEKM